MGGTALNRFSLSFALALLSVACRATNESPVSASRADGRSPAASRIPTPARAAAALPDAAASDSGAAPASENPAETKPKALPPLSAEGDVVSLPVEGFRDAIVYVPRGAVGARPVLVALHGNFDRPEWQCEVWQGITRGFPFILCPRGIPRLDVSKSMDRWEYGNADAMERELEVGLQALSARFGEYVDPGPVIFTGFSLGAIMGVRVLSRKSAKFPIAVLTEGGYAGWSPGLAKAYKEKGGQRVLFACGQLDCPLRAKTPVQWLTKAGVEAKIASGGKVGHTYDGPVARAIASEWEWLIGGDPRWQPSLLAPH